MTQMDILLVGAGGHARSCIDVIEEHGLYRVAGLVGTAAELGSYCMGYQVMATDDNLAELVQTYRHAMVVVGQISTSAPRRKLYALLTGLGYECPTIVSPRAYVSKHAHLGAGTVVMHGAIVNAAARVGSNCIINSRALIEHDATIGDHCHISTGAIVNGSARVGSGSFLGSTATVRDGITLGENCVVAMGMPVRKDLPDHTLWPNLETR